MGWGSKTDYVGLYGLGDMIKATTENVSGQYAEITASGGGIVATAGLFGVTSAPVCDCEISRIGDFAGRLGMVKQLNSKCYIIQSVHYETAADSEPVLTVGMRQVENTAYKGMRYSFKIPSFNYSRNEVAKDPLSAFTLTGKGCELVRCTVDISCEVHVVTVNGVAVASDVSNGHALVSATIGQYGTAKPDVAATAGWEISAPLSCTDPDADLPSWTVAFSKPLTKAVEGRT